MTASLRAENDAYYTPDKLALVACHALRLEIPLPEMMPILEPSCGGGAWIRAAQKVWPGNVINAMDIDPHAPGLWTPGVPVVNVGDFLKSKWVGQVGYGLTVGNPPYGGDTRLWVDKARSMSNYTAFLLRQTFIGAQKRLVWWRENRPLKVWTLIPRPKWAGAGARKTTDTVETCLILWGPQGEPVTHTILDWLEW